MRYAFRVAYVGDRYHGLARQPNVPTVEGAIMNALTERGYRAEDDFFLFSSRTDKGVHAFANVFAAEIRKEPKLGEINSRLKGIWIWAYAPVPHSFNPIRDARLRWYRYIFPHRFSTEQEDRMREAAALFVGRHDFSSFAISWTVDSDWLDRVYDYWAGEERKSMVRASLARARLFFQP